MKEGGGMFFRLGFLLVWLLLPFYVYADGEMNTVFESNVADLVVDFDGLLEKVRKLDPEFVSTLDNSTFDQHTKIVMLRSYLAKKAFEYYQNKFLSELKRLSVQTGRKIMEEHSGEYGDGFFQDFFWLDRGDLEKDRCDKKVRIGGKHTGGTLVCPYPDGFQEVRLFRSIYDSAQEVKFGMDDYKSGNLQRFSEIHLYMDKPEKNLRTEYRVVLAYLAGNDTGSSFEDVRLNVYVEEYKYDEYHAWRNQDVADAIAGKYDIVGSTKQPKGSPFGKRIYHTREGDWKSNNLPASRMWGVTWDYDSSSAYAGDGKQ